MVTVRRQRASKSFQFRHRRWDLSNADDTNIVESFLYISIFALLPKCCFVRFQNKMNNGWYGSNIFNFTSLMYNIMEYHRTEKKRRAIENN